MITIAEKLLSNTYPRLIVYIVLWIFTTSILMYYVDMCIQFITFSVA